MLKLNAPGTIPGSLGTRISVLRPADSQLRRGHRAPAVRRESHRTRTAQAQARPDGSACSRSSRSPAGWRECFGRPFPVQLAVPLPAPAWAADQRVHPGHDGARLLRSAEPARYRAGTAEGPVRLHQYLGQLPDHPGAVANRRLVVARHPPPAADNRGPALAAAVVPTVYSLNRGMWVGVGLSIGYVAVRLAARGRLAVLGTLCAGLASRRRDLPGDTAALGDLRSAGQRPEQRHPYVAVHERDQGRAGLACARLRWHEKPAWQPALDRRRAHRHLPPLRQRIDRQQRPAVAAPHLGRLRRHRALSGLLCRRCAAVPSRHRDLRDGRRARAALVVLVFGRLRRRGRAARLHDARLRHVVEERGVAQARAGRSGRHDDRLVSGSGRARTGKLPEGSGHAALAGPRDGDDRPVPRRDGAAPARST